jgi:glycosyltransferase involved in cell wall biosynthesis
MVGAWRALKKARAAASGRLAKLPGGIGQVQPVTVTVAIPTLGREEVLIETIREVLSQSRLPDEILIVDQTPEHSPATVSFLAAAENAGTLRWLRQSQASLTKARNRALSEASSAVVLFLDDDVRLPSGFLQAHLRHYESATIALVAAPIFSPRQIEAGLHESVGRAAPRIISEISAVQECVRGCNHSVRLAAAIQNGGYDQQFVGPSCGEEVDFALRLYKCGARLLYDPAAWLVHLTAPMGGCRIPGNSSWNEWQKSMNQLLFMFRYAHACPGIRWAHWKLALRAGPLRRENLFRFWRQPWAWMSFLRAVREAKRRARKVCSPFGRRS